MQNYFNYFTEIETRFQQRRGSLLMLSTLDWSLIETWREAGIPLEAVLRGIDDAFDKHDAQKLRAGARRTRKINGLAWAAQAVMQATEAAVDAATGVAPVIGEALSGRAASNPTASRPTCSRTPPASKPLAGADSGRGGSAARAG